MSSSSHDRSLAGRLRTGDADAFDEVVQNFRGTVYGYLRARLTSTVDAQNLLERTFAGFIARRGDCESDERIRPVLLEVAREQLSQYVESHPQASQSSWTSLCLLADEPSDAGHDEPSKVISKLELLAPAEREAVELRYRGDRSLAQIGQRLRRSESAVRDLLTRARRSLKGSLRP